MDALEIANSLRPDIVLIDISIPTLDGIEATKRITVKCPDIGIIILSVHDENILTPQAMEAGGRCYVSKFTDTDELVDIVRREALARR